jgi:hypothetical protein
MNHDLRYDGPDLEADVGSRSQGTLMAGAMVAEAAVQGLQARAAARLDADRKLWRDTPADQLPELGDEALARQWQACARHHGDSEANEVRGRIEAELTARDPATMRDYRTWRNAGGADPGRAMQSALWERDKRMRADYLPLAGPGAEQLASEQLLTGWVAAHQVPQDGAEIKRAKEVGERLLREREPELMSAYDALRAPASQATRIGGDAEAAARLVGGRAVFGDGWSAVRAGGAAKAATAARTAAPAAAGPAGAAAAAAGSTLGRLRRWAKQGQQL